MAAEATQGDPRRPSQRRGGRHRRRADTHKVLIWLRTGSVVAALGAAVATGQGVASADAGTSYDGSSTASHTDGTAHDSTTAPKSTGPAADDGKVPAASVSGTTGTVGTTAASPAHSSTTGPSTSESNEKSTESHSSAQASTSSSTASHAGGSGTTSSKPEPGPQKPTAPAVAVSEIKTTSPAHSAATYATAPAGETISDATTSVTTRPGGATAPSVSTPLVKKAVVVASAPKTVVAAAVVPVVAAATPAITPSYPAAVTAPVTLSGIVSNLLTWAGLPALGQNSPIPAIPIPEPLAALWIGVRELEYRVNNQYPTARPSPNTEQPYTGVITGNLNATDPDGDHLTYTVTTAPSNGSVVVNDDGSYAYTPAAAEAHAGGADSFSVTVSDDNPYNVAHIHGLLDVLGFTSEPTVAVPITVTPVKTPTVTVSAVAGTPDAHTGVTTIIVTATDSAGNSLTLNGSSQQGVVTSSLTAPGLTFTPGPGYTPTDVATNPSHATDTVDITATDTSGAVGTTNVTITQKPAPAGPPVITEVDTTLNTANGKQTVTITATDKSGKTITYTVNHGTLNANTDGTYTYTPDPTLPPHDQSGDDPTTYTLTATNGDASTTTTVVVPTVYLDPTTPSTVTVYTSTTPTSATDLTGPLTPTSQHPDGYGNTSNTYTLPNHQTLQQDPLTITTANSDGVTNKTTITQPPVAPTKPTVTTFGAGDSPVGIALSPDGSRLYVGSGMNFHGVVTVIDTATHTVVGTIHAGDDPQQVTLSPDGSRLYVVNRSPSTVTVVDVATAKVLTTVAVDNPDRVVFSPNGELAYVTGEDSHVYDIDTSALTLGPRDSDGFVKPIVADGAGQLTGIAISPGGGTLYVANFLGGTVSLLSTSTDTLIGTAIPVGIYPNALALSPNGSRLYVTNFNGNTVSVIDTATATNVATIAVQKTPLGVAVSNDGSRVYVVNRDSNTISVIDTASNSVIETVPLGDSPEFVVVSPDGAHVYVTLDGANQVADITGI